MKFIPYLSFNGNCREAFEFYAEILGGEITTMTRFGDEASTSGMPDAVKDLIMFARLNIRDGILMASDMPPNQYQKPQGTHISISFETEPEAKKAFVAFSTDGAVIMPFAKSFFSDGFGITRDRFGTLWMINVVNTDSKYY